MTDQLLDEALRYIIVNAGPTASSVLLGVLYIRKLVKDLVDRMTRLEKRQQDASDERRQIDRRVVFMEARAGAPQRPVFTDHTPIIEEPTKP